MRTSQLGPPLRPRRAPRRGRRGLTLVEVAIAAVVLAVAVGTIAQVLGVAVELGRVNRETGLAAEGARRTLEELQAAPFAEVFARYDDDPENDPGGIGTAPGASFAVLGLAALAGDPDGEVGEIVFPTLGGELREDVQLPGLGGPWDLDGDGAIDGDDHADDYRRLPVLVRVRWDGGGRQSLAEYRAVLIER